MEIIPQLINGMVDVTLRRFYTTAGDFHDGSSTCAAACTSTRVECTPAKFYLRARAHTVND